MHLEVIRDNYVVRNLLRLLLARAEHESYILKPRLRCSLDNEIVDSLRAQASAHGKHHFVVRTETELGTALLRVSRSHAGSYRVTRAHHFPCLGKVLFEVGKAREDQVRLASEPAVGSAGERVSLVNYDGHLKRCGSLEQRRANVAAGADYCVRLKVLDYLRALLAPLKVRAESLHHLKRRLHGERLGSNIAKLVASLGYKLALQAFLPAREDDLAAAFRAVMRRQSVRNADRGIYVA